MKIVNFLRLYYNYFLVKYNIRKVLPSYFINKIKVVDCNEELVLYQDVWVRKSVAKMLDKAQKSLPKNFTLQLASGYRNEKEQKSLLKKYQDKKLIAQDSGHSTGGAVDVILLFHGKKVNCGEEYLSFTPATPTWSKELTLTQKRNRFILYNAMIKAGFINYPLEWWHFCYGDKMYAAYSFNKTAFYGKVEVPWQPNLFKTE